MAELWVKIEKSTPDKPEIFEIAEELDIDPDAVLGKLIRVWCWVDSNSEDGHIKSVTHVLIDRLTGHKGFAQAMETCGWLTKTEIPNFHRHLGESAKKRAKDAERKRKSRNVSKDGHTESVTEDVTQSGLDKRREEKNIKDIKHFDQQAEHEVKKIDSNAILENLFDQFWNSGIRKAGKKNARTVFRKILSGKVQKQEFTDYLIRDIQFRLTNEQQGFDLLHPTTYLRGERWTDEKLTRSDKPNNSGNGGLDFLDDNEDTGWAEEICREYEIECGSSSNDGITQQEFENVVSVQTGMEELSEQESRIISQGIPKPVIQGDD